MGGGAGARYFAEYEQWEAAGAVRGGENGATAASGAEGLSATPPRPSPRGGGGKKKLSYKEQREMMEIEGKIEAAEAVVKRLEEESERTAADHKASQEVFRKLGEAHAEVTRLYERWGELGG